ncbi:MAG: transglutaminase domain-containing protein [Oscillospiraceae bacterium]|nr:transglutaminase domain-containing protein [Oscillospiraceae bacterium]
MKYLNLKNGALLVDAICAFGLSCVALWILLPFTYPVHSLEACIFLAAAATVAIFVFSRKWWILPALFGIIVPLTLAVIMFFDPDRSFFGDIRNFDPLSAYGSASGTFPPTDITDFVIRSLMALILSGIFFLYLRKLFVFLILPPLLIGASIYLYIMNPKTAIDLLPLMLFVGFVALSKYQGMKSARLEKKSQGHPAHSHMISATLIIPIVLLVAVAASPKVDGKWKSESLGNFVEDISDVTRIGFTKSAPTGLFNISFSGFSPLDVKLGGDVIPNNTPALYVNTETPIPLAGTYFDTYDGVGWYDRSSLHKYRYNSLLTLLMRKEVFQEDIPSGGKEIRALRSELLREVKLSVNTVLRGSTLFSSGKLQEFSGEAMIEDSSAFFNEQGELYVPEAAYSFMTYYVETLYFDRSLPDFNENMLKLEQLTSASDDPFFEKGAKTYLQLPDTLPESVILLAEEITEGSDSPYSKALAIEKWLADNCEYTLTPGNPPDNVDFVAHFLETRKGYCTYYASAMTVMARSLGVPARYVNGFLLKRSPFITVRNNYISTHANAHAWTEIYLKGIGWIAFDPLVSDSSEIGFVVEPESNGSNGGIITPTPIPSTTPSDNDMTSNSGHLGSNSVLISGLTIALTALFLIYVIIRAILLFLRPEALRKYLTSRNPDLSSRVESCYLRILKQYAYLGYSIRPGETVSSFLERIDAVWFEDPFRDIFDPVIRLRFALLEPTEDDLIHMTAYSSRLERRLIRARSPLRYFFRRLLFGSI